MAAKEIEQLEANLKKKEDLEKRLENNFGSWEDLSQYFLDNLLLDVWAYRDGGSHELLFDAVADLFAEMKEFITLHACEKCVERFAEMDAAYAQARESA